MKSTPATISRSTKIKILHLEDLISDADLVANILNRAKIECEVKLVSTREQYTEALEEFKPQLILCDHNLPSFNSIEALEILKQSKLKIPFVLVTGTVSEEFAVEAMRAGADDYILKDRLQRLPVAVQNVLEKYRLEQEKKKSETLLRNIDTNSLDMICSVSEDGYFLHVSAASEIILGYPPAELIGKKSFDFVYTEDKQKTIDSANYVMEGNLLSNFQNRYVRKDGSLVTLSWSTRLEEHDRVRYGVARDVTEKNIADEKINQAEKVIASERKRLYDLFMNAPVSMCITSGRDHVYELANPIYIEQAGEKDLIGKAGFEVFPELAAQGLLTLLNSIYDSGQPFKANEMEFKVDREGNGQLSSFYQNVLQQPYRDVEGNVAGLFYFGVDVTEQVLARKKIEESEKKYRMIVETAQEGIWLIDEKDLTTFVNRKLCEIIEYTEEELLGKEIYHFMDDESTEKAKEQIERRKQGISEIHDSIFITKSKKSVWVSISTNPVVDETGVYKGALAMITNISDRKIFESTLLRRDYQLTIAAQISKLGYWEYDVINDLFTFNDQFYDIFKTTAEKVGGYTMTSARYAEVFVHPDDQEIVSKSVVDAIKSDDADFNFTTEHRIIYANGEIGYISVHFKIIKDETGRTIKNFGVNQDITERKKVELERLALIDNLLKRNQDLQQFSYIVSHNLRAPIAKIMGLASIIDNESEENKFLLEKLTEETANLDDVVKDINTIVSARKSSKEKMEPILFQTKLGRIKQVLEDKISESGASIIEDFSAAPELVTIKSYLYSILYNLISNSIKYRQADVPLQIEVKSAQDEKFICLSVKDNGEGIDLVKNGTKVFGLYKRFHTGSVPGKGIGLNLVKTHAESLGGRVEVESKLNQGTTFKVYIPKK